MAVDFLCQNLKKRSPRCPRLTQNWHATATQRPRNRTPRLPHQLRYGFGPHQYHAWTGWWAGPGEPYTFGGVVFLDPPWDFTCSARLACLVLPDCGDNQGVFKAPTSGTPAPCGWVVLWTTLFFISSGWMVLPDVVLYFFKSGGWSLQMCSSFPSCAFGFSVLAS